MAVGEARGVPGWSEPHSHRYGASEARYPARRSQASADPAGESATHCISQCNLQNIQQPE
jgi:hypothetical protein